MKRNLLLTNSEIKSELHETTRQCLTRHQFETWGDALTWMLDEDYDVLRQECGRLGYSKLSTEILWLIALFGPQTKVDQSVFQIKNVPSLGTPGKTFDEVDEMEQEDREFCNTVRPRIARQLTQSDKPRRPRRKRY